MDSTKANEAKQTDENALAGVLSELIHAEQTKKKAEYWKHTDTDIEYEGRKIRLPGDPTPMAIDDAITALKRKQADENQEVDVHEVIDAFPMDGAVAFVKALKHLYGWANSIPTPGFFGPENPKMLTVNTSLTTSIQVPWGQFQVPGVENPIAVDAVRTENGPAFVIAGTVRKREQGVIKQIAELTREILKTDSIYRGKAVRLKVSKEGKLALRGEPQFIDTSSAKPEDLIMSRDIEEQIETSLLTPIKHTQRCIKEGIPLNRGILLEGKYGTGKTMTAMMTGQCCENNDWTFILLDNVKGLPEALLFAQRYQPAVVFAEDVDRIANSRDESGNDLLNTIDGALTKSAKVITVLTTNYVERIHNAMLRPGRLDAVISVTPPDGEAVTRLLRLYGRSLISQDESLVEVGEHLRGQIPATIREVVERSKLAMIGRDDNSLVENDLLIAAKGMTRHLELLNGKPEENISDEEALGKAFAKVLAGGSIKEEALMIRETVRDAQNDIQGQLDHEAGEIKNIQNKTAKNTKQVAEQVDEVHSAVV